MLRQCVLNPHEAHNGKGNGMAKLDKKAQEAVEYLPENGAFVTYDAWKQALMDAGKVGLIPATRTAKQQGLANFVVSEYEQGVLTLEVQRANPAQPMARAETLRTAQPPARLIPAKGGE